MSAKNNLRKAFAQGFIIGVLTVGIYEILGEDEGLRQAASANQAEKEIPARVDYSCLPQEPEIF